MKNLHVDGFGYGNTVSQKDWELEELLCLAYLFTHSVNDEVPEECEISPADYADLYANNFCN